MTSGNGQNNSYPDADHQLSKREGQAIQWPTVSLAVGLSALASALVIGVGSAVMIANADSDNPVVIADGSAVGAKTSSAKKSAAKTTSKSGAATTSRKAGAGSTTSANAQSGRGGTSAGVGQVFTGGTGGTGGGDGGESEVFTGGDGGEAAGSLVESSDGAYEDSGELPPIPSSQELLTTLEAMVAPGADQEFIESNLETPSGAQTFRDTTVQMENYPGFHLEFVDEPYVEDGVLTGQAKFVYEGMGEKPPQDFYWVVRDGRWVLSDESVCTLAIQARVACTV
ncbi:hypothetical protein Csp1_23400 [Corynebacterium provencense]|uniref:Low molecular weight antigen MTB12-like C-terminal domain-containing protein n=1 Tax=Corynebacterium provencense TaxID=1737425 RepID=A0A2Z3YVR2_9CORY|nr:hypothetical protein [Corynebacterium provencense]AWT27090.1 hypothetical protein Csp1_23400 [Corynebacterium provencense]